MKKYMVFLHKKTPDSHLDSRYLNNMHIRNIIPYVYNMRIMHPLYIGNLAIIE